MSAREPGLLGCSFPGLDGATGRGVSIAVIDSGIHPGHPHLRAVAGGIALDLDGEPSADLDDRLGHGTAVTAAIQEKAPEAEVFVVKVFDRALKTSVRALVRAIDAAAERGVRVVNLSLGTPHAFRADTLSPAVQRARARGSIVVSAHGHGGVLWLPGSLPGALGVALDRDCPRDAIRLGTRPDAGGPTEPALRASGLPRPIPGVPEEHNVKGISFAVANATGILALALEGAPEASTAEAAFDRLSALATRDARSR